MLDYTQSCVVIPLATILNQYTHACRWLYLGTLILKIPWKKIYTEPVEVVIEDLFAIAGPNAGMLNCE